MFRIMDKMWKKKGLNLKLNPYGVIPTGAETGMVEVVTNSNTVSKIQKEMAGSSLGAFDDTVLFAWLQRENPDVQNLKVAIENVRAFFFFAPRNPRNHVIVVNF